MKSSLLLLAFSVASVFANAQRDSIKLNTESTVQIEAKFPGGVVAWGRYLSANLNNELADSCLTIPKGKKMVKQTVIVSFIVDKEGRISDAKAENAGEVHPRLAAEAVRVVLQGPNWVPATQNGRNVNYRQKQSITWVLSED
ncbi:MAG TPA: energy transducer TonB [Chitinophagaceae bacterium]